MYGDRDYRGIQKERTRGRVLKGFMRTHVEVREKEIIVYYMYSVHAELWLTSHACIVAGW